MSKKSSVLNTLARANWHNIHTLICDCDMWLLYEKT